jgi:thiamine-phosphate pyrophosphorylase
MSRHDRLRRAHLYLVCDARPDRFLEAALRGGVDLIQLRCKGASESHIVTEGARYSRLCAAHDALFILNDRPDLVVQAGADGAHVGQDDMPVEQARELIGPQRILGRSTHSPSQIDAAAGVDYIGVGPVHATPTKPGRPAAGLQLVRYAAGHASVPFFAIGGIDVDNAAAVRAAGGTRIAVVRALTQSADPESTARRLRSAVAGGGPLAGREEALVGPA